MAEKAGNLQGKLQQKDLLGEFLAKFGDKEKVTEETQSRVSSGQEFRHLLYLSLLSDSGVKSATKSLKSHLALAISKQGEGRREAVHAKIGAPMKKRNAQAQMSGETGREPEEEE